jgi:hypothetical protein
MQKILENYNLERIDYLRNNRNEISSEILKELRSYGVAGKQIALDILELKEDENMSEIHILEIQKCKEDLFYFKDNYILILNSDELQNKLIKGISKYQKVQITSDRSTKKTYAAVIYALHEFNFARDKIIAVVSSKSVFTKVFISNTTNLYNQIPSWMRIKARNLKTSMTSEMNVKIIIGIVDENSFRGYSLDMLIIENAGAIKPTNLRKCLDNVMPGMIHNKDNKIIVLEINENTNLLDLESSVQTEKPIIKRTLKEFLKEFLESLYKRIKGI